MLAVILRPETVRPETASDVDTVRVVHDAAFATADGGATVESRLLDALRTDPGWIPGLSLVVEVDGAVVGHVASTLGSWGSAVEPGSAAAIGLGPIGILPEHQGAGLGSALVRASLERARELGFAVVCLLGEPAYYSRFGFVAASELGITAPDPAWGPYFQALVLGRGTAPTATFRYAAPFDEM